MPIIILDPTDGPRESMESTAPRLASLQGRVLGIIDNGKHNSRYILEQVAGLLKDKHAIKEVILETKNSASLPIIQERAQTLAGKCDMVLAGVGD